MPSAYDDTRTIRFGGNVSRRARELLMGQVSARRSLLFEPTQCRQTDVFKGARYHVTLVEGVRGSRLIPMDWRKQEMAGELEEKNKTLVLKAFDTLFNKREYAAAERFWSPHYIQHSAHIAPGREGLFNLIKSIPPTLKYEPGMIVAEEDFVIVHGRFSGFGQPVNWIAADIVRIENGILIEHWDVIQDEATEEQSKSGIPMFGDHFRLIPEQRHLQSR